MSSERWVCLDVGETLIDETRVWSIWADTLGIPRLTFMAALGGVIARGGQHRDVFAEFAVEDWPMRLPAVESAYGGFQAHDLYPDALPSMAALRAAGYRLAVIANQPEQRAQELRSIGVEADAMAMSAAMRVAKPDPGFYAHALELMGNPDPADVAYVGDRIDNDVVPSVTAGMRAVWLRRGPWGIIQRLPVPGVRPALIVDSLTELVQRIDEVWPPTASGGR